MSVVTDVPSALGLLDWDEGQLVRLLNNSRVKGGHFDISHVPGFMSLSTS